MSEILTEAREEARREMLREMEKDVLGAWQAGYDYLHVYQPAVPKQPDAGWSYRRYTHPSNSENPLYVNDVRYQETYVLDDDVLRNHER